MEWLTNPLTKKVTVSSVNCKLKELRQLQGIYTHVYHLDLPIHDSQRMSCMFCGQSTVLYTGFIAGSRTEFRVIFRTISMRQAWCIQMQVPFTAGTRTLCPIGTLLSYFLSHREHSETFDGFGQPVVELGTARTSSSTLESGTIAGEGKGFTEGQVLDTSSTRG